MKTKIEKEILVSDEIDIEFVNARLPDIGTRHSYGDNNVTMPTDWYHFEWLESDFDSLLLEHNGEIPVTFSVVVKLKSELPEDCVSINGCDVEYCSARYGYASYEICNRWWYWFSNPEDIKTSYVNWVRQITGLDIDIIHL